MSKINLLLIKIYKITSKYHNVHITHSFRYPIIHTETEYNYSVINELKGRKHVQCH